MISRVEELEVPAARESTRSQSSRLGYMSGFAMLLWIVFFAALSIWGLTPPRTVSATAPPTEFSSDRAMSHVRVMAQKPHPIGSTEHATVRAYILSELAAQGINPEVQEGIGVARAFVNVGATVRNVIGRLRGENNTKAVLLAAHYDSVPNALGASDNAAGVATLLETLRALKSGPPLKNDVIFLFTDGQEAGSLGARAFVEQHPWAKDVGLVLNFEARGTRGPVFMFETTRGNGGLIKKLAKAVEYPTAASYMYDVYKRLPNDTDLRAFRQLGVGGLNFAYIHGSASHHTFVDNVQNLDQRSLQHDGFYALSLTREFGNADLNNIRENDAVYFDLLGLELVHYPVWLVIPVAIALVLFFGAIMTIGFRKRNLTRRGVILGFVALLSSMICVVVAGELVGLLIPSISDPAEAGSRASSLKLLGLVALTIVVVSGIYAWFARKTGVGDLAMGAMFCWLILMAISSFFLPGASYLFAWPLFFSLLPLGLLFVSTRVRLDSPTFFALVCLCSIPALVLIVPTVYSLYMGIGLQQPGVLMILLTLLTGLLIPPLSFLTRRIGPLTMRKGWAFIGVPGLLAAVFLAVGTMNNGVASPKSESLFYGLNADTGEAIWATTQNPGRWTRPFFSSGGNKRRLGEFFPFAGEEINSPAPPIALTPPNIARVEDSESNGVRTLRLRITSPREAHLIEVFASVSDGAKVVAASVNGKEVASTAEGVLMRYFSLPREGIEFMLKMNSSQPLRLQIADYTYGIAQSTGIPIQERPEGVMMSPLYSWWQDTAAVSKSYTF